jgi:tetratricopeptide (TPR) repeat protein
MKAEEFFVRHKGYEVKTGACKNLLGTACNTLEQFELAEEYLLQALDCFQQVNEDSLVVKVRHNLGMLYADQGLSDIALRHLTDVYNANYTDSPYYSIRTIYLLARESFKVKKTQEASKYIEEGLLSDDVKYNHHFKILKTKNDNLPVEELEGIFLSALEYFREQELWKDVIMYSEELANKWYEAGNKDKTSTYFHTNYEARQIFKKKGSLK